MHDAGNGCTEGWRVSGGFVGDDTTRCRAARSDRLLEEPARGNCVAGWRHIYIHDLTDPVDGSIDVMPTAANASVGLVDPPVWTDGVMVLSSSLANYRKKTLHPTVDGALIDKDATLGQQFTNLGVAEAVANVSADGQGDNVVRKAATRERRTGALGEAPTTLATAEPLATELGGAILGHGFRITARARHRQVLHPQPTRPISLQENPPNCLEGRPESSLVIRARSVRRSYSTWHSDAVQVADRLANRSPGDSSRLRGLGKHFVIRATPHGLHRWSRATAKMRLEPGVNSLPWLHRDGSAQVFAVRSVPFVLGRCAFDLEAALRAER